MPDTDKVKEELPSVVVGMDSLTKEVYPGAFPDDRQRRLVYDYFVRDYLGDDITINFEYLGFIARQVTDNAYIASSVPITNEKDNPSRTYITRKGTYISAKGDVQGDVQGRGRSFSGCPDSPDPR